MVRSHPLVRKRQVGKTNPHLLDRVLSKSACTLPFFNGWPWNSRVFGTDQPFSRTVYPSILNNKARLISRTFCEAPNTRISAAIHKTPFISSRVCCNFFLIFHFILAIQIRAFSTCSEIVIIELSKKPGVVVLPKSALSINLGKACHLIVLRLRAGFSGRLFIPIWIAPELIFVATIWFIHSLGSYTPTVVPYLLDALHPNANATLRTGNISS